MRNRIDSSEGSPELARPSGPGALKDNRIRRVVIFTGGLLYSVRKGIAELVNAFPETEWLIVEHTPRRSIRSLLRNQWRNIRKNGWRWIPYQTEDIAMRVAEK